jgi:hypothetical protein
MHNGLNKKSKSVYDEVFVINTYSKWFNFILLSLCFFFLLGVRIQINNNVTGDEPYYLLMDYSMVHDHDLALTNNYKHKDFTSFYNSNFLGPQGTPRTSDKYNKNGYSLHQPGLSYVLLPGFYIAAKTGAVVELAGLATLLVWLTWLWSARLTKNRKYSYIAAASVAVCYFFSNSVGTFYPDMLIATLTLTALLLIESGSYKKHFQEFILGLPLGFLVIVHYKTLAVVLPMLAVLCFMSWKSQRRIPWITLATVAIFVAYYYLTLHGWFGRYSLSALEGGQSFGANPFNNLSAMLFDSNRGLLVYNPVFILMFVGLPIWFKKHRKSLLISLASLLPSILALCMIPNWNGSESPVGRYLLEFLPAFVPAITFAMIEMKKQWQRIVVGTFVIATFMITIDAAYNRFKIIDSSLRETTSPLLMQVHYISGIPLDRLLFKYYNETTPLSYHSYIKLAADYAFIFSLMFFGYCLAEGSANKVVKNIFSKFSTLVNRLT